MLGKMIAKIMLKAAIPLLLGVGLMSYQLYMRGGDPGALLSMIGAKTGQSMANQASNLGDNAMQSLGGLMEAGGMGNPRTDTVYRWVDENGMTHFSNSTDNLPPGAVVDRTIEINPDQNVMTSNRPEPATLPASDTPLDENNLPGMAGALQRAGLMPRQP